MHFGQVLYLAGKIPQTQLSTMVTPKPDVNTYKYSTVSTRLTITLKVKPIIQIQVRMRIKD